MKIAKKWNYFLSVFAKGNNSFFQVVIFLDWPQKFEVVTNKNNYFLFQNNQSLAFVKNSSGVGYMPKTF